MPIDRVSTYGIFQSTLSNITRNFGDLSLLQNQISSGYKSPDFAGIFDNARSYMQLEDQISRSTQFLSNNRVIESRIQTTNNVLSQVIETGTQLKSLIAQRRTKPLDVGVFGEQLESIWRTLAGQLNTTLEGRFLFSGGRTDAKAVDDETFPTISSVEDPGEEYYQGDNQDLTVRVSDGIEITYNVRANDEAFKNIFGAIATAKEADDLDSDEKFVQAFDLLDEGLQQVVTLQAKSNSNIVELGNIRQNQISLQTYWKGLSEEIANTDLVSASTQVAINQGILQASFQAFARINSLRLSDYLR